MLKVTPEADGKSYKGYDVLHSFAEAHEGDSRVNNDIFHAGGIDNNTIIKFKVETDAAGKKQFIMLRSFLRESDGTVRKDQNGNDIFTYNFVAINQTTNEEVLIPVNFLNRMSYEWKEDGDTIVRGNRIQGTGVLNNLYRDAIGKDEFMAKILEAQDAPEHNKGMLVKTVDVTTIEFIADRAERAKTSHPKGAHSLVKNVVYNVDWKI